MVGIEIGIFILLLLGQLVVFIVFIIVLVMFGRVVALVNGPVTGTVVVVIVVGPVIGTVPGVVALGTRAVCRFRLAHGGHQPAPRLLLMVLELVPRRTAILAGERYRSVSRKRKEKKPILWDGNNASVSMYMNLPGGEVLTL